MITTAVSGPTSFDHFIKRRMERAGIQFQDLDMVILAIFKEFDFVVDTVGQSVSCSFTQTYKTEGVPIQLDIELTFVNAPEPSSRRAEKRLADNTYINTLLAPNHTLWTFLRERIPNTLGNTLNWYEMSMALGQEQPCSPDLPLPVWEFFRRILDKEFIPTDVL